MHISALLLHLIVCCSSTSLAAARLTSVSSLHRAAPRGVARSCGAIMGVQVKTVKAAPPGAPKPKPGDILACHYTGWLKTGLGTKGKQFDTSRGGFGPLQRPPFKFALGRNRVIKAWDIGIAKMRVGEMALLTCSSDLCYGRDGAGPIPPNADLIFEVELVAVDGYQPNVFEQQRGSTPKMRMEMADVGFLAVFTTLLAAVAALFRSVASDANRAVDAGIGARGIDLNAWRPTTEVSDDGLFEPSIADTIRQARSTSAPGFVFELDGASPEGDAAASASADTPPPATSEMSQVGGVAEGADELVAAVRAQAARAALLAKMEGAVEREDYAAAAELKKELATLDDEQ